MSRYVVRIVGPAGGERYLKQGREIDNMDAATHYPHPSNAWVAAVAYATTHDHIAMDVIDTRDRERRVS